MDSDSQLIAAVLTGDLASFETLVRRYQARIFATARRYARRESEVEDIVQEVFVKAFQKLATFRGDAPFDHWLMRLTVRTCYDFLRVHQRDRVVVLSDLTPEQDQWLERFDANPNSTDDQAESARELIHEALAMLSPAARLIITLLELEDRSVKDIAALTGWSVPLVKVRAFRARKEMRKCLERILQRRKM